MRLGVLTLHDSLNYGALLQAYALRSRLTSLGHEAVVIDRCRSERALARQVPSASAGTFRLGGVFPVSAHDGLAEYARRMARSYAFVRERIGLSPHGFVDWNDAPADLGLDAVVVGSDQVWNANRHDPGDYLLGTLPRRLRGISYAASFGMSDVPETDREKFVRGLSGFSALGIREREGVELARRLGFRADQVVDPVLLAGKEIWNAVLATGERASPGRVFCYFLAEDFPAMVPALAGFSKSSGKRIDFFVDRFLRPRPQTFRRYWRNRRFWERCAAAGVDFRLDAGPEEFVRSIAAADAVVTNSYHALMFALVFDKEARVVLPTHPRRRQMNARLVETGSDLTTGPLIAESPGEALASLAAGERVSVRCEELSARVRFSAQWLSEKLAELEGT